MTDKPRFTVLHGSGQRAEDLTGEMADPAVQLENDGLVGHMTGLIAAGLDRIKQLTAERDRLREMVQASVSFMNGDLTAEEWNEVCMRPWQPPALKGEGHD